MRAVIHERPVPLPRVLLVEHLLDKQQKLPIAYLFLPWKEIMDKNTSDICLNKNNRLVIDKSRYRAGGISPDARKCVEFIHSSRDLAAVLLYNLFCCSV